MATEWRVGSGWPSEMEMIVIFLVVFMVLIVWCLWNNSRREKKMWEEQWCIETYSKMTQSNIQWRCLKYFYK